MGGGWSGVDWVRAWGWGWGWAAGEGEESREAGWQVGGHEPSVKLVDGGLDGVVGTEDG